MIFWTWRSYFIRWQIFENKVWCPVSKKRTKYFHFLLSLAYPIDRLDWALFSVVILFHHFFPLLEKVEIRVFILPRNFPAVLIIFPPSPRGAGRPSLSLWHLPQCRLERFLGVNLSLIMWCICSAIWINLSFCKIFLTSCTMMKYLYLVLQIIWWIAPEIKVFQVFELLLDARIVRHLWGGTRSW